MRCVSGILTLRDIIMDEFTNGIITGLTLGSVVGIVLLLRHISTEIAIIKQHTIGMLSLIIRIEKTSQATMEASEGFIDGLRQSVEQMHGPGGPPPFMQNRQDHFRDLRSQFEEGINRLEGLEQEMDDDDDDEPGHKEEKK